MCRPSILSWREWGGGGGGRDGGEGKREREGRGRGRGEGRYIEGEEERRREIYRGREWKERGEWKGKEEEGKRGRGRDGGEGRGDRGREKEREGVEGKRRIRDKIRDACVCSHIVHLVTDEFAVAHILLPFSYCVLQRPKI